MHPYYGPEDDQDAYEEARAIIEGGAILSGCAVVLVAVTLVLGCLAALAALVQSPG